MSRRGLGTKVPDPQLDPLDAIVPEDVPPRKAPRRTADTEKLSIRMPVETLALLRRLAAFTPDSMASVIAAGAQAEARRRERQYEKQHGRSLPEL